MNNKIAIISLGCSKNLVDSEQLVSKLIACGYETADDYHQADLVIVNTCGFIDEAIQESLEIIADAVTQHGKVIVTGCLGKRKQLILEKCPTVLHVFAPADHEALLKKVQRYLPLTNIARPHQETLIKLTPPHYAYLKIAEGCHHQCAYCIIPQIRGTLVSRPMEDILREANQLKAQGVKELLVVAQDTAAYGQDSGIKKGIIELSRRLSDLGIWIRLHYLYPYAFVDELVTLMQEGKILPYLDVPLQHCNPRILALMKRPGNTARMLDQIKKWRDICPDIAIRSTFIVGFPSETDAEFNELLDFLEQAKLDRVGCFAYSNVKGAPANALSHHIPESVKQERLNSLMNVQRDISAKKLAKKIGSTLDVIVDEVGDEHVLARTKQDAPDVDGNVVITTDHRESIHAGDIFKVTINDSDEYDLYAHFT